MPTAYTLARVVLCITALCLTAALLLQIGTVWASRGAWFPQLAAAQSGILILVSLLVWIPAARTKHPLASRVLVGVGILAFATFIGTIYFDYFHAYTCGGLKRYDSCEPTSRDHQVGLIVALLFLSIHVCVSTTRWLRGQPG